MYGRFFTAASRHSIDMDDRAAVIHPIIIQDIYHHEMVHSLVIPAIRLCHTHHP